MLDLAHRTILVILVIVLAVQTAGALLGMLGVLDTTIGEVGAVATPIVAVLLTWTSVIRWRGIRLPLTAVALAATAAAAALVLWPYSDPIRIDLADAFVIAYQLLAVLAVVLVVVRNVRRQAWAVLLSAAVTVLALAAVLALATAPLTARIAELGIFGRGQQFVLAASPAVSVLTLGVALGIATAQGVRRLVRWSGHLVALTAFTLSGVVGLAVAAGAQLLPIVTVLGSIGVAAVAVGTVVLGGASDPATRTAPAASVAITAAVVAVVVLALAALAGAPAQAAIIALATLVVAAIPLLLRDRLLRAASATDELTGLPNRRALDVAEQRNVSNRAAVITLDLREFSAINTALGRIAGDQVLVEVGRRLTGVVGRHGVLARISADEFAVYLGGGSVEPALQLGGRLLHALAKPLPVGGTAVRLTADLGVAVAPDHARGVADLLAAADIAQQRARRVGAPLQVFTPGEESVGEERLRMLEQLRTGLVAGQLVAHYQPQVQLNGHVEAVEALVRWRHPERGLLPPVAFLDLAAEAGVLPDITMWMLRCALDDVSGWRDAGIELRVSVNLPPVSLVDGALVQTITGLLAERRLPPNVLTIEVTEEAVMRDDVVAADLLRQIRAVGIGVAIDDFGTGYSSLARLRDLPIDEMKLDRSFISKIRTDRTAASIVVWMLGLARSLHLRTVAEGVEDTATLALLSAMGVDLIQGYVHAKPMPAESMVPWLMGRSAAVGHQS